MKNCTTKDYCLMFVYLLVAMLIFQGTFMYIRENGWLNWATFSGLLGFTGWILHYLRFMKEVRNRPENTPEKTTRD